MASKTQKVDEICRVSIFSDQSSYTPTVDSGQTHLFSKSSGVFYRKGTTEYSFFGATSATTGILKYSSGSASLVTAPTGTILGTNDTQSVSNKTLDNTNEITVRTNKFTIQDGTTSTKQATFNISNNTAGQTRDYILPNSSGTVVLKNIDNTFSQNQTMNNGIICYGNGINAHTGGITLSDIQNNSSGDDVQLDLTGANDYSQIELINPSLNSIKGIKWGYSSFIVLINNTGNPVTIKHNKSVTGIDVFPIFTGSGTDIVLQNDASLILSFNLNAPTQCFNVVGGTHTPVLGNSENFGCGPGDIEAYIGAYGSTGFFPFVTLSSSTSGACNFRLQSGDGNAYIDDVPIGLVTPNQGFFTTVESSGSILSTSSSAGIGYSTGAGGSVTQLTSKSTGVTLNTICGDITMHNASLSGLTAVTFTLTNSTIASGDQVIPHIVSGGSDNSYLVQCTSVSSGSCKIQLFNITAATTLSEAVVIRFHVFKTVNS